MKDLGIERRGDKKYYIAAGLGSLNLSPLPLFFSFFFPLAVFFAFANFPPLVLALLDSCVFLWFSGFFCFGFMVCFGLVFWFFLVWFYGLFSSGSMVCFALVFFFLYKVSHLVFLPGVPGTVFLRHTPAGMTRFH